MLLMVYILSCYVNTEMVFRSKSLRLPILKVFWFRINLECHVTVRCNKTVVAEIMSHQKYLVLDSIGVG